MRDKRQALAGARPTIIVDGGIISAVEDEDGDMLARRVAVERERGGLARRPGHVHVVGARDGGERRHARRRPGVARQVVRHQPALRLPRRVHAGRVDAELRLHGVEDLQHVGHVVDAGRHLRRPLPVPALALAVFARRRVHDDVVLVEERHRQEVQVGLCSGVLVAPWNAKIKDVAFW